MGVKLPPFKEIMTHTNLQTNRTTNQQVDMRVHTEVTLNYHIKLNIEWTVQSLLVLESVKVLRP